MRVLQSVAPNSSVAGGPLYTNVSIVASLAACSVPTGEAGGSPGLSPGLLQRLTSLSNTSPSPADPAFGAFLAAAALSSRVPLAGVSAVARVGTPQQQVAAPASTAPSSASSAVPLAAVVGGVVAAVIVLAAAGVTLVVCARSGTRLRSGSGAALGGGGGGALVHGENPMYAARAQGGGPGAASRGGGAVDADGGDATIAVLPGEHPAARATSVKRLGTGISLPPPDGMQQNPMYGGGGPLSGSAEASV